MTFMIDNVGHLVSIDRGDAAVDTSALPANVDYVTAWDYGLTRIQYNDGTPRGIVIDPTPYAPFINAWVAARAGLTLSQAKFYKTEFLTAMYNGKRQLPVTAAGHLWPATDAEFATIASKVAAAATVAHTNISLTFDPGKLADDTGPAVLSSASITVPPLTASLTPVGEATPVSLNTADLLAILSAVNTRRDAALQVRNAKQTAIAALTSVAAVASYDLASGW